MELNPSVLKLGITTFAAALALAACSSNGSPAPSLSSPVPSGSVSSSNPGPTSAAPTTSPTTAAPVATESNPPGDIPDNQAFVPFASTSGGFTVRVPEGWARTGSGSAVSFTDKLNSIAILDEPATSPPTAASLTASLLPALRSSVPQFQLIAVAAITRPAGAGFLVTYLADSATDPVTGKVVRDSVERYVFWHGGRLVTLTLTGPKGADNVDPWRKVTDSLSWSR